MRVEDESGGHFDLILWYWKDRGWIGYREYVERDWRQRVQVFE